MSLTFIDPLSENFAYLSPVTYCLSCAQLVFNTLPGASPSSSLNTAERGCHRGNILQPGLASTSASQRQRKGTATPGLPLGGQDKNGPGKDRMGHGPP